MGAQLSSTCKKFPQVLPSTGHEPVDSHCGKQNSFYLDSTQLDDSKMKSKDNFGGKERIRKPGDIGYRDLLHMNF
jgi:hypothetical protein